MIVNDLNIGSAFGRPDEANTPLLADPDAVLTLPITLQRFETAAGQYLQVIKNRRPVQLRKLAEGRSRVWPACGAREADGAWPRKASYHMRLERPSDGCRSGSG